MCDTKLDRIVNVAGYYMILFQVVNGYISIPQVNPSVGKDACFITPANTTFIKKDFLYRMLYSGIFSFIDVPSL